MEHIQFYFVSVAISFAYFALIFSLKLKSLVIVDFMYILPLFGECQVELQI